MLNLHFCGIIKLSKLNYKELLKMRSGILRWVRAGVCGCVWVRVGVCGCVWVCVGMCGYYGTMHKWDRSFDASANPV